MEVLDFERQGSIGGWRHVRRAVRDITEDNPTAFFMFRTNGTSRRAASPMRLDQAHKTKPQVHTANGTSRYGLVSRWKPTHLFKKSGLEVCPARHTGIGYDIADIGHSCYVGDQTFKTQAEASMWHGSITP